MNTYCDTLGIAVPSVEKAAQSRDACSYSLLIAVLLERGGPVTLEQAAQRMAAAGVGDADSVLDSLKRCRPARPPIYRNGDLYELDPHDDEADLWAFRLGLRPSKASPSRIVEPEREKAPLPGPETRLTLDELAEAWRRYIPVGFSAQRLAVSVLDAHGRPMKPEDVAAYVQPRSNWHSLSADAAQHWGHNAPVRVREDGLWELRTDHEAVRSARRTVRALIETERRHNRPSRADVEAAHQRWEQERETHAKKLERLRRVLIHAFPTDKPEAIVLIDISRHQIETYRGTEIGQLGKRLKDYDVIAGLDVRNILRALDFDHGIRHLHELGATQKTRQINRAGRTLKITTEMIVRSSCGISRPLGEKSALEAYLREGKETKLRRRMEADAKALVALYQYGRFHGHVRLRWGFLDEALPTPWGHRDERSLYDLMKLASEQDAPLEVVVGSAPGWEDPWSRARPAFVRKNPGGWHYQLFDADGCWICEDDVQSARLTEPKQGRPVQEELIEHGEPDMAGMQRPASKDTKGKEELFTVEVFIINGPMTKKFVRKNKVVSRTIQIRGDQTLQNLHEAIFDAFDREEEHMYEFQVDGKGPMDPDARKYGLAVPEGPFNDEKPAGDVSKTTMSSVGLKVGDTFGYWFDFGDDWWHQINVVAIDDKIPAGKYPKVTKQVGESPPQYADLMRTNELKTKPNRPTDGE